MLLLGIVGSVGDGEQGSREIVGVVGGLWEGSLYTLSIHFVQQHHTQMLYSVLYSTA
jgi:hypothetical protein